MRFTAFRALACVACTFMAPGALAGSEEFPPNSAQLKLFASMSGVSASSFFERYSTESCETKEGEGRLATFNFVTKKEQSEFVPAGARAYILGVGHVTPNTGGERTLKNVCRSLRSFVPEVGHTYEIRQDQAERNCPISIKDAGTGAEVKSDKHKVKGPCREKT
jgi:hypothetical protein